MHSFINYGTISSANLIIVRFLSSFISLFIFCSISNPTWSFALPRMGSSFSYPNSRIVETSDGKIQGRRLVYRGDKQVDAFQVRNSFYILYHGYI